MPRVGTWSKDVFAHVWSFFSFFISKGASRIHELLRRWRALNLTFRNVLITFSLFSTLFNSITHRESWKFSLGRKSLDTTGHSQLMLRNAIEIFFSSWTILINHMAQKISSSRCDASFSSVIDAFLIEVANFEENVPSFILRLSAHIWNVNFFRSAIF